MDTRLLRSYLAVARSGSFTRAAAELGFTQSTVTSHVQKLEQQLGSLLLDRLPGSVVVTELGARVTAHAEEVLAAEQRLRSVAKGDGVRPSGTVRVMAPETLCTYWLPVAITAVRTAEPAVQVWVSPGGIDEAIDSTRRGTIDLAVTMELHAPPTDLQLTPLGSQPLVFLQSSSTGPATARGEAASWAELAQQDALLLEEGCGYSDHVADQLAATGRPPGRRSRFGSVEAIKRCVDIDLGWTVLPRLAVAAEIRSGTLSVLEGPHLPDCEVHALSHPRRYHGPAATTVLDALRRSWPPAPA